MKQRAQPATLIQMVHVAASETEGAIVPPLLWSITMTDKCTCGENDEEHPCPYAIDIDGVEEDVCACCEFCTNQCAQDI